MCIYIYINTYTCKQTFGSICTFEEAVVNEHMDVLRPSFEVYSTKIRI
jgi:hypothetical protein